MNSMKAIFTPRAIIHGPGAVAIADKMPKPIAMSMVGAGAAKPSDGPERKRQIDPLGLFSVTEENREKTHKEMLSGLR